MKRQFGRAAWRFGIPALLAFSMQILGPLAVQRDPDSQAQVRPLRELSRMVLPGTNEVQLIIELSSPSIVQRIQSAAGGQVANLLAQGPMNLQSVQASAYRAQMARERQALTDRLSAVTGVQVQRSTEAVMHAIIARVPVDKYREVSRLPGVKKVYFSRPKRLLLDAAAGVVNAQALWNVAGGKTQAGRGVKIGIIDTGIDITNPMFIDTSLFAPGGFPKSDNSADLAFTNSKVIVARNYINLLPNSQRVLTAVDEVGHGTFVAGVAAGKQVTAPGATISGMAPSAWLGSYKIFGTPGVNDTTTDAAIIAAIDDAVQDGMDIINLSLGALDYVPPSEDPEVTAVENAIAANVIVTIAAGNDGPSPHTISSPGTSPDAITVGAVTNSRLLGSPLHVTAPAPVPSNLATVAYVLGSGPSVPSDGISAPIVDAGYGCSAFSAGTLTNDIALVQRGSPTSASCFFSTKINNAAAAGAVAVIVYDNVTETPFVMAANAAFSVPGVMISQADGLNLKAFIATHTGNVQVTIDSSLKLTPVPTTAGVLTSFSAVGPSMDFSIKPDMVAVGQDIYSAAITNSNGLISDPSGFVSADGTSFSAPMVAGAAAGLKQLFLSQNLSPQAIKSMLTSTASQNVTVSGGGSAQVLQMGSGLLNMGAAAAARASFAPSALNFGSQAYTGSLSLTRTLVITNLSNTSDQFGISVNPIISGPTITLSRTNTGPVPPGSNSSVDVTLQVTAPQSRGFQGFVTIQSSNASTVYQIPYWAGLYVLDSSRILSVGQTGSSFTSLPDALKAARPGNIIELDTGTYPAGLTIDTNSEGLPLDGITIRAASGRTPVLDGTAAGSTADIQMARVQGVSLQGLTINGGSVGVEVSQVSADVPVSVTLDHCIISNMTDPAGAGIFVDSGGTLHVTKSTISNVAGVGIVANPGTYLTVLGSTVQNTGSSCSGLGCGLNDGIDAFSSNVEVLNSTIAGNNGSGIYLESSTGTLDGNTFSKNIGQVGDAVEVFDGNVTITNNTFDTNDEDGVYLGGIAPARVGPVARIANNTFTGNKDGGLYADFGQSVLVDSNLIKDNARGAHWDNTSVGTLVNNIIIRSTDASQGDGVQVAGSSKVQILNNTIYKNTLSGVHQTGGTASVANTIVAGNTKEDVLGVPASNVQFCFIGDGKVTGNSNQNGSPGFTNPASDDYSLGSGSPAVNAGSNSAPGLPFLDYNRHFRVAGASLPGQGNVDMGAIESNSTYPLIFPLLANGIQSILGDNFVTGYAMLNGGTAGTTPNFVAYNPTGGLVGSKDPANLPSPAALGVDWQRAILGYELFGFGAGDAVLGSMLVSSPQPLAGFFLLFDSNFSRFSIGANASNTADVNLLFMRHESDSSGEGRYVVSNPGVNTANVTVTPISTTGTPLDASQTVSIAPQSQSIFSFDKVTTSSGYVSIQSDRPVSGLEVISNSQAMSALDPVSPGTEARLFFPHFAVNGGFSTQIGIVNATANTANVTVTAYDGNGQILGNPALVPIQANGQLMQSVDSLFSIPSGPLTTGYIVAQSDQPIQGFTAFRWDAGTTHSAAVVPAGSVPKQLLLFSHVAHQIPAGSGGTYQTGIALLNPFGVPVGYTLRVFDASGVKIAEMTDTLGPGQKIAKYLSHSTPGAGFFTQPMPLGNGHVEVQTDYGLLGFELFFTETFSQLASVPAQTLK